ncbi:LuxR C-terminal-related transcriptional regulator [Acinetobacter sp. P8-3-8]|uniref:LuxR C-terminal-related transcriptional regulator n=1 Tax=Acinetobacter sp. P8-3-8 TaxID=1029823 RepID=UPI0002487D90|nr:LuxR C-terminal-related transcriptional regulator [Acinetobacter sp. P8-3-8]
MRILKTKLSRPTAGQQQMMQRPQLLAQLLQYSQQAMLLIHAAAGYGKTTLMRQLSEHLLQQGTAVKWLTLDTDDNDPIRLYQYLRLVLLEGAEQQDMFADNTISQQSIYELLQQLPQRTQATVLFIDEFEQLENKDSLNLFWWLYQHLPEHYHLVIASRVRPEWSLSKEILLGRIQIVTENQLSLKPKDTASLVEFLHQQNPEQAIMDFDLAQLLIDRTEGWMTGIQLTNLYLKDRQDVAGFIQNLSGAHHQIVNYLSEQVFLQQDAEIQQFLLKISVLRKVNLALVMELTGNQASQHLLDAISQKGLFIQALDEQRTWFRIHHLFRDFLLSRFKLLQADAYREMHSKAAEWFKQHHYLMNAIYHAQQAEDEQLMLLLLKDVSRELVLEGRIYTLLELVKQLPEQTLVQNPTLLYDIIWSLLLTHQSALANHYLQLWHSVDQHQTLLQHEDQLGLAPLIALSEDKWELAYRLAEQNLAKITSTAYFSRGPLIGITGLYHVCLGEITEARKLLQQTRVIYVQGHNLYGLGMVDCMDALCDYLLGDLALAAEKFSQIGYSEEYQKLGLDENNKTAIMNILSSFKADLYYELNQLDQAEKALVFFNGGDHLTMPDMVIVGYILQMRLATLSSDQTAIQTCLNQVQTRSSQWSLPRLSQTILAYAQPLVSNDSVTSNIVDGVEKPLLNFTHLLRGDDLIAARTQIFSGHVQQAIDFLVQQTHFFKLYPLRQARVKLLLALAFYQLKQNEQAFDYLQQALLLLMPTQAVRIILDEHPSVWEMLHQFSQMLITAKQENNSQLLTYIQHLFSLQERPTDKLVMMENHHVQLAEKRENDTEGLSKREIQILEKVSEGLTDSEIADLIFLSVNTVKWHLRNIYNKLMVRSRLEAVTEAKKKGHIH